MGHIAFVHARCRALEVEIVGLSSMSMLDQMLGEMERQKSVKIATGMVRFGPTASISKQVGNGNTFSFINNIIHVHFNKK